MKRILNYTLLLLFVVCFCVNCQFQSQSSAQINSETDGLNTKSPVNPEGTPPDAQSSERNGDGHESRQISCGEKELAPIWEVLTTDKDVKELVVDSDVSGDCSDYVSIAKRVDLNEDGIEELFVEGNGNFGNVSTLPIWVIGKDGEKFKILLREQGEVYEIMTTRTNGYNNLYFPSRRSVWSSFLSTYKFEDGNYLKDKCQVAFYNNSDKPVKVFACDEKEKIGKFESEYKFEPSN